MARARREPTAGCGYNPGAGCRSRRFLSPRVRLRRDCPRRGPATRAPSFNDVPPPEVIERRRRGPPSKWAGHLPQALPVRTAACHASCSAMRARSWASRYSQHQAHVPRVEDVGTSAIAQRVDLAAQAFGRPRSPVRLRRHPADGVLVVGAKPDFGRRSGSSSPRTRGSRSVPGWTRAGSALRRTRSSRVPARTDDRQLATGHHARPLQHIGADAPSAPAAGLLSLTEGDATRRMVSTTWNHLEGLLAGGFLVSERLGQRWPRSHPDRHQGRAVVDRLEAGPMTAATWGCCPALRHPGEPLTPRRRVPRARGPRRGRHGGFGRRRRAASVDHARESTAPQRTT